MNQKRAPFTPDEIATILALKEQGAFAVDVAARFGCSRNAVHAVWQRQRGVSQVGRVTPAIYDRARRLREDGESIMAIARIVGVPRTTLMYHIKAIDRDIKRDAKNKRIRKDEPAIILPPRITVQIPERVQRMRDSLKARGMSHEAALKEAMRICAGSAVEDRGISRAAGGGVSGSFHAQTMPAERRA